MAWGIYIATYLFMAGMGAGAFLTAVVAFVYSREGFRPLIRAGIVAGGPLVALGLPFLVLDLGAGQREPWRIFWLYFGNIGSIMTWGTWIITAFVGVGLLSILLELDIDWRIPLLKRLREQLLPYRFRLLIIGSILAFATATYTGLLLGVVVSVPFWNTPLLPSLFVVSALSTGMAAAVVTSVLFPMEERKLLAEHFFYLNQIHSLMIVVELIFLFSYLFIVATSSITGSQSVGLLLSGGLALPFWIGVVFFGIVDPLLLYIYEVVLGRPMVPYAMLVSDGSVLVGGFVLRFLILSAALPVTLT
ncbi:MAG: polysulfide reductase NrfD [Bacteroidetes bacterium]|nr:polysulfide reductase NrfD [Bacteroidota bacterium]